MFPKVEGGGWQALGEIGERVRDIGMGCCVLRVERSHESDGFNQRMTLPLWRSLHSLNLMLPKEDRKAMLLRLFNEDIPLQDHSKDRFNRNVDSDAKKADGTKAGAVSVNKDAKEEQDSALVEADEMDVDEEDDDEGGISLKDDDMVV